MAEPAPTPAPAPAAPTPVQSPRRSRSGPEAQSTAQLTPRPLGTPPAGLPPAVGKLLASPGPGEPLPTAVQAPIAERLGVDPRAVRVHAGPDATDAADLLQARAFAYGNHIFIGRAQRITDLSLMAHEVAHVVQQQGGTVVQRSAFTGSPGGLELEAQAAGAAVASGRSARVVGRTAAPRVQGSFFGAIGRGLSAVGGAIVSGVKAVGQAVAELGAAVLNAALDFIKEHARSIPGYDLLAFLLGKDPITQQPVERNAINLIKALVGLIPGGAAMFENIQKAGVIQKAADWFSTEVGKLDLTWPRIRGLFQQAWDKLSASDILSPSTAWEKIKSVFGPPVRQLVDFAISAGKKLLELIFEGAIALGGSAAQQVLGFFRRIQSVFALIVADPVKFLSNLVAAAKGGFQSFAKNIVTHLKNALFNWLFGALAGALKLPAKFDLMGIIDIVLQVLGLTYERFRERLVKLLGEPAVKFLEGAFEFLKVLVTQGIAAAWKKLLEFATTLVDTAIGMVRDWVVTAIVGAAVKKIVLLFNPLGAIIEAIIGTYNTVMFFIEKAKEVMTLINAIVDSIENIARGNIAGAVAYVEKMLASALVVLINFLARYAGLSKVADAIKDTIKKIQDTVWGAIDKVLDWLKKAVQGLLGKKEAEKPDSDEAPPEKRFDADEPHRIFVEGEGDAAVMMIASEKKHITDFLADVKADMSPKMAKDRDGDFKDAIAAAGRVDNAAKAFRKAKGPAKATAKTALATAEEDMTRALKKVLEGIKPDDKKYEIEGLVGTYSSMPRQPKDRLTPDHQPQNALLTDASSFSIFKGTTLGGYTQGQGRAINLHENRHMEGRTWGSSKSSAAALAEGKDAIRKARDDNKDDPDKARKAVVRALQGQLNKDADAMDKVVSRDVSDAVVWGDIQDAFPKKQHKVVADKIKARVRAGERSMRIQPLNDYAK